MANFLQKMVGETSQQQQSTLGSMRDLEDMFKDREIQKVWRDFTESGVKGDPAAMKQFFKERGINDFKVMAAVVNGEKLFSQWNQANQAAASAQARSQADVDYKKSGTDLNKQRYDYFEKTGTEIGSKPVKVIPLTKGQDEALKNQFLSLNGVSIVDGEPVRTNKKGEQVLVSQQDLSNIEGYYQDSLREATQKTRPGGSVYDTYRASLNEEYEAQQGEQKPKEPGRLTKTVKNVVKAKEGIMKLLEAAKQDVREDPEKEAAYGEGSSNYLERLSGAGPQRRPNNLRRLSQ